MDFFPGFPREKIFRKSNFCACTEMAFSSYCCSAVLRSLIARPPPFLGVSSLNLAAPRSGHFFARVFWALRASRVRSWTVSPRRSTLLLRSQNPSRKTVQDGQNRRRKWSSTSHGAPARASHQGPRQCNPRIYRRCARCSLTSHEGRQRLPPSWSTCKCPAFAPSRRI